MEDENVFIMSEADPQPRGPNKRGYSGNQLSRPRVTSDAGLLKRELYCYRIKYLFTQSCTSYCKSVRRRVPTGVGVYVILLMLGLEQMAFTSAGEAIITPFLRAVDPDAHLKFLVRSVGLNLLANLLFPVMGGVADVWVGRHRMIHLSMWLLFCGYGTAAFSFSLEHFAIGAWNEYILLPCYIVINIGSAGFQANAIPFGADQINYKTSHELSSYFYMYYWMRNAGSVMLCLLITCDNIEGYIHGLVYSMIAVLVITANLLLNASLQHRFLIRYGKSNPLKTVFKVLSSSLMAKRPRYRSAFSYNPSSSQPSRMDLTKEVHGGTFKEETVEDVKTFLRLLLVLFALGIILFAYVGVGN